MPKLTEEQALALLRSRQPIRHEEELEDVFLAFRFVSDFEAPNTTWWRHERYDCGEFRSEPLYPFSVLSDAERGIVLRMLDRLMSSRRLWENR